MERSSPWPLPSSALLWSPNVPQLPLRLLRPQNPRAVHRNPNERRQEEVGKWLSKKMEKKHFRILNNKPLNNTKIPIFHIQRICAFGSLAASLAHFSKFPKLATAPTAQCTARCGGSPSCRRRRKCQGQRRDSARRRKCDVRAELLHLGSSSSLSSRLLSHCFHSSDH